ncbi:MAG: dockerin type I repeat-containing protein [Methanosarcinales archaeon]|nr:dockerin type I repeat-containing protein [Methanosarcinales archaeon]
MKTEPIKPAISILVLVLLSLMIPGASAESLQITDVHGDSLDYAIEGDALTILVSSDGPPVAGADVYFRLNEWAPVHVQANETGIAAFKPLVSGTLQITAKKGTFEPATTGILVSELQKGDLNGDGVVTAADAVIALEIAAGSRSFDSAADVSGDGQVTSLDALMILQAAAGEIELGSRQFTILP